MFLLIPPKNIDIKSYKQSVQTIKKRLDDTVGESEYLLKKKKDSLELILPLSVFPGENLKEERENLVKLIKELKMSISGTRGYNEAIITKGGLAGR